jgi:hypothetical protein
MQPFLKSLFAAVGGLGRRNSAPRREQCVQLNVEIMEARLVPSTVVGKLALPISGPAQAAPLTPVAETNGEHGVADPNAVHGYKWRRPRWPWEASNGQTVQATAMAQPGHPLVVFQDQPPMTSVQGHTQMAQGSHLFVGGDDGLLASASHDGHIVVRVPEGPLPTDFAITQK